jgi:predicted ester cyclase
MSAETNAALGRLFFAEQDRLRGGPADEFCASEDSVAVRFRLRGTQTGDFMGIPATGKPIAVSAIVIMRISDGKVTELKGVFDQFGLMQQLGVIPG